MDDGIRQKLDALIHDSGEDYSSVSRLLGRNPAYIQQFIKRGSPRKLAEQDRMKLAAYFRVSEEALGGRPAAPTQGLERLATVPRIEIRASAGPGGAADIEERGVPMGFDPALLRDLGVRRSSALSVIRVSGDSMEPTLRDGDDILVDRAVSAVRSGAIHIVRIDDMIMVKRLVREGEYLIVRSDNPAYADIRMQKQRALDVVGRVLWCGRRLV